MLTAYITQTQRLLNDEAAQFYQTSDLTAFINIARNTIATQTDCLVSNGSLATVNGQQTYGLAALTPPAGLQNAINVRSIISVIAGVGAKLESRPWAWFLNYELNGPAYSATGTPTVWSMQNLGSMGNLWFSPTPNGTVLMNVEASWIPVALTTDATPENLSYPWTDAVPYFAAYLAYTNAQRQTDAQKMLGLFNAFVKAARIGVTPEINPAASPNLKGMQAGFDPLASNQGQTVKPAQGGEGALG